MPSKEYFIGISLGASANEKTAMVVTERSKQDGKYFHSVVITERFALGAIFAAIAARVYEVYSRSKREDNKATVILDTTEVGVPVVTLFEKVVHIRHEIILTQGLTAHRDEKRYSRQYIPKRDIIGSLQIVYQERRYGIAEGLRDAETLARQAEAFMKTAKAKTGTDSDRAEREGTDDDILLAWAVATWAGETGTPTPHLYIS